MPSYDVIAEHPTSGERRTLVVEADDRGAVEAIVAKRHGLILRDLQEHWDVLSAPGLERPPAPGDARATRHERMRILATLVGVSSVMTLVGSLIVGLLMMTEARPADQPPRTILDAFVILFGLWSAVFLAIAWAVVSSLADLAEDSWHRREQEKNHPEKPG